MTDQWYYWSGSDIIGPFSGTALADLAATGKVLPTDIVWREGVERGVPAGQVRNLFPAAPSDSAPPAQAAPPSPGPADSPPVSQPAAPPAPVRGGWDVGRAGSASGKARAVAGKGAMIVGQDGNTVKYLMKCTTCGCEDRSWRTMPITRGTTRVTFFCPKCRRARAVEVHGHMG
jgi:GYF domain 2